MNALRPLLVLAVFIGFWWGITALAPVPAYMLPAPPAVAAALWSQRTYLAANALTTLTEMLLGLAGGTLFGGLAALSLAAFPPLNRWLMPVLVLSQSIPVFALAPLLVLWFGFGLASKILLAMLVIFFPITANFADGLRRADPGWLDLARTMNARPLATLRFIRLPAALPAFGSGLRIAAAVAPIGAVLGEWAGASSGLGYVMLNANARIQTPLMFAALGVLAAMAMALYAAVDFAVRRWLAWAPGA